MIFKEIFRSTEKAETYLSIVFDWREFDPSIGVVFFFNPWGGVLLGVRLTVWRWFFHCCICRSLKLDYMLNEQKAALVPHMKAHQAYIKKEAPNGASD